MRKNAEKIDVNFRRTGTLSLNHEADYRPSLSVSTCKEDQITAAILLCGSFPAMLCALRTTQDKNSWKRNHQDLNIYRQLINFLRHVVKGQNLLVIMPRFRVTSTHPWIMSAAIKSKWTLNILLPIVYFGLWNKINLRFSRVCLLWMARMQT